MFAYRWLLLDCKREFPFKDILRVFESLWASLPIDRFESEDPSTSTEIVFSFSRQTSTASSMTTTFFSSRSSSLRSLRSSLDETDSGCPDEIKSAFHDQTMNFIEREPPSIPLSPWLKEFTSIDNQTVVSDMFTIFLCVGLLEQNRSSIMKLSMNNVDADDRIGSYFSRLLRQNNAEQALQLARHYFQQYVFFQSRLKQLLKYQR